MLLSVLAGQWRYAHITALRGDGVNPALLGMRKVASEDSVRRGLERIEVGDGASWLQGHLDDTVRPLLSEPWILDCDTTIKPLYGHQEGAVVSYNPKKPGRPSHAYHAFLMAGTRLVLDVAVAPGRGRLEGMLDRSWMRRAAPKRSASSARSTLCRAHPLSSTRLPIGTGLIGTRGAFSPRLSSGTPRPCAAMWARVQPKFRP